MDQFNKQIVGSKSSSQALLKSKLPAWVKQPASLAIPFGAFEKVLALEENNEAAHKYKRRFNELGQACNPETLLALRQAVGGLSAPDRLKQELREAFDKARITTTGVYIVQGNIKVNGQLRYTTGFYKAILDEDAKRFDVPAQTPDQLAAPLDRSVEVSEPRLLKAGESFDTEHLRIILEPIENPIPE
jgi:hypothetical protein